MSPQMGRQRDGGGDDGGHAAFHVGRAAPIEPAVVDVGGEGLDAPRGGAQGHDVDVAGEAERRLVVAAADAGDEVGTAFVEQVIGDVKAGVFEDASQVFGAGLLVAGRVDRVEADQFAGEFNDVDGVRRDRQGRCVGGHWAGSPVAGGRGRRARGRR